MAGVVRVGCLWRGSARLGATFDDRAAPVAGRVRRRARQAVAFSARLSLPAMRVRRSGERKLARLSEHRTGVMGPSLPALRAGSLGEQPSEIARAPRVAARLSSGTAGASRAPAVLPRSGARRPRQTSVERTKTKRGPSRRRPPLAQGENHFRERAAADQPAFSLTRRIRREKRARV
jgi:hypothetical protein